MKVAIISDLHLGVADSKANQFLFSDAAFAGLLDRLAAEVDWVLIAGDIFELWEGDDLVPPQTEELFRRICESWPLTIKSIAGLSNVVPLSGNHDAAARLKGWLPKAREEVFVPELSLFVAHGHQGDRGIYKPKSSRLCFVECLACCLGGGEELGFGDELDQLTSQVLARANAESPAALRVYARDVAARAGVNVVCFGHTHEPELTNDGGVVYANSGACVGKRETVDVVLVESSGSRVVVALGRRRPGGFFERTAVAEAVAAVHRTDALALPPGAVMSQSASGTAMIEGGRLLSLGGSVLRM